MDPAQAPEDAAAAPEDGVKVAENRQLHPLPLGLVELYGLLAVLVVLMPEWLAGGALRSLNLGRSDADLPAPSMAWQRVPELRLATMSLAELRLLAHRQGIAGYGRLERLPLTQRLLLRLRRTTENAKSL